MNIFLIGLLVLVLGAILGGLIEYLLGLILPKDKPPIKHIITIIVVILMLGLFVTWLSAKGNGLNSGNHTEAPVATSTNTLPSPTETATQPVETNTPDPVTPTPNPTTAIVPTRTPQPKPTATTKATYSTNNPAKWLLPLQESGYVLEQKGSRNNLEASREFDYIYRASAFELFSQAGRITSAYEDYSVSCSYLSALVTISQEVMTFPTEKDATTVFDYFHNHPHELPDIGVFLYNNPEMLYRNGEAPGDQNFLVSTPRTYTHCGQNLDLFQAIVVFQRENIIGIVMSIGRDDANTRIPTFFFALDLDLNILANP